MLRSVRTTCHTYAAQLATLHHPTSAFYSDLALKRRRAVVYSENGNPADVLRVVTVSSVPKPPPLSSLNVRFLLSPINPSDINVVEGVYPAKPSPRSIRDLSACSVKDSGSVFVGGNEGLAEVVQVGDDVQSFTEGDWVLMVKQQSGTWCSDTNVGVQDVVRIPRLNDRLPSKVAAATITVNPPTAYNLLHGFVDLKPGDWIVQNGANSAVGQAVIQIAAHRGLRTLNLVRDRENFRSTDTLLTSLGATRVLPYSLLDPTANKMRAKETRASLHELFGGSPPQLGLNCISGAPTAHMTALLDVNSVLVSYGAMSKEPLSIPTSLLIFKNITCKGFWQSRWYSTHTREERDTLMRELVDMVIGGKLKEPENEVLTFRDDQDDASATRSLKDAIQKVQRGQHGKKILMKFGVE